MNIIIDVDDNQFEYNIEDKFETIIKDLLRELETLKWLRQV